MFVRGLVLGLAFLSAFSYAHGSHDEHTWEKLDSLLKATFVELHKEAREARPEPTKLIFVDLNGDVYSVQKSEVAEAIGRSIELNLIAHCKKSKCEEHCKKPIPTWRVWAGRVWRFLISPIVGAKEMAIQLPPTLSELAGEFGVLPAVAVITLWVPYTFVTETIESAVMGAWHWACQFFQAVYWGPVTFVFLNFMSIKEAVLARSPEFGVAKKLWYIFSDRWKEWQFSRALKKGFTTETSDPDVPLHPGGYTYPNFKATEVLSKLYKFIDSQLEAAQESGRIGYWSRVSARYQAGRLKALINSLRHARFIINHQKNRAEYEAWIKSAELAIQDALYAFHLVASGRAQISDLKNAITESSKLVLAFRRGDCSHAVALPEMEAVFQLSSPVSDNSGTTASPVE